MDHISSDCLLAPSLQGSHTEGQFVGRVDSSYSGCKDELLLLLAESMRAKVPRRLARWTGRASMEEPAEMAPKSPGLSQGP